MLACVPVFAPASEPIPTLDPNAPLTAIVETAAAAWTQTALFAPPTQTPTDTPLPMATPTETATPTFVFFLPTLTPKPTLITPGSTGQEFQCQVISQSPNNGSVIQGDTAFNAVWVVTNVGKSAWLSTNTDYRYQSGDRLHTQPAYDFEFSVASGANVELKVSMKAPSAPGSNSPEWRIAMGNRTFCPLKLSIVVN
jgi:hypothetical protein